MAHEDMDYYGIGSLLTDEEHRFRKQLRRFTDEQCMPIIADHFDKGSFPLDLIPHMAGMGLFSAHYPARGKQKLTHSMYGIACEELGRCDSGLRAMFSVQNSLAMFPIAQFGSEEHQKKWLPPMSTGEVIGCFGLSEPDYGSNPSGMHTQATKKDNHYILNGTKMWITNGSIAHLAVVWAKLDGEIRGFLVETKTPGFRATPIQRKFSYRTSPTALLVLEDCRISEKNLLPGSEGIKSILQCLNLARFGVACGALGSAIACYQEALAFARKREVFDKPIAAYQLVQDRLVKMAVEITKAQLMNLHLGRLMDADGAKHTQISMAKLNNVREAMKIARMARDILGARGILADNHVIRHLCDLEAINTLEGTESIHTLIIGRDITGSPAFF